MMMRMMKTTTAMKEPIRVPEILSQKPLYCWHIGNQFEFAFPWCATSMMAAAAAAADIRNTMAA